MLALDPSRTLTQYSHRIWGQEEGLFQPTIYSILQTSDGYLWLGTQDSLIRFDGSRFHEMTGSSGEPVLHGALVRTLLEDKDGTLWAGSIGSGLALIHPDGSVTQYNATNGFVANTFCLDRDSDGSVSVCTEKGLYRFQGARRELAPLHGVRATCHMPDGSRWVADFDSRLWRFEGGKRTAFRDLDFPTDAGISSLSCAGDGSLWVGSGMGLLHITGNHIQQYTDKDGLPDNAISTLIEGPDESLWIGSDEGISRFQGGEFHTYRPSDGLSHSVVLALQFDREGTLWAGTKDGLDQFTNGKVRPYTEAEGMPSNDASAIAEDQRGRLWIGTLDSGVAVFDGHHFRAITKRDGLASDKVLSLVTGPDGDLWIGTSAGLNRVHQDRVANGPMLVGQTVRTLLFDQAGQLWAGTNRGLFRVANGTAIRQRAPQLQEAGVLALGRGLDGEVLISTDTDRVPFYRDGRWGERRITGVSRMVDTYLADAASGSVWMGTLGGGLLRWHDGKLTGLHVKDGLYDNRIYGILDDQRGNLWIASSKGIFRLSKAELIAFSTGKTTHVHSLPFSTGQLRFECQAGVQPTAHRAHDGRLWFATTSGAVVVNPNHLGGSATPPPVRVTSVLIDGQQFRPREGLRLGPSERNLEIRYTGLSFIDPEKVTFRYILDGYDHQWTDAGPRRAAFFTKLPPGHYRFRVMARSADGVWSREAATVDFEVTPLLYQRRWFWPACVGLLALAIAAAWRLRMRQMRQRFSIVLSERTRIARELHDTLLQGMAGVTMQLQALWTRLPESKERATLGSIIQDAGVCAAEARKSLWGLRESSSAALFSDKLSSLVQAVSAEEPSCRVSFDGEPTSLDDRPEVEFQMLRIAREALSNALEHSRAGRVRVTLARENKNVSMQIADDGIGFASERDHGAVGHFGLLGMSERAREIGAELAIESRPGSGTTVTVHLPLERS